MNMTRSRSFRSWSRTKALVNSVIDFPVVSRRPNAIGSDQIKVTVSVQIGEFRERFDLTMARSNPEVALSFGAVLISGIVTVNGALTKSARSSL